MILPSGSSLKGRDGDQGALHLVRAWSGAGSPAFEVQTATFHTTPHERPRPWRLVDTRRTAAAGAFNGDVARPAPARPPRDHGACGSRRADRQAANVAVS